MPTCKKGSQGTGKTKLVYRNEKYRHLSDKQASLSFQALLLQARKAASKDKEGGLSVTFYTQKVLLFFALKKIPS